MGEGAQREGDDEEERRGIDRGERQNDRETRRLVRLRDLYTHTTSEVKYRMHI